MQKKIIIGQFNECYLPILDGVSLTVHNYASRLHQIMGDTYVVTPYFPGYSDSKDFPVIRYLSAPVPMRKPYRMGFPFMDIAFQRQLQDIPFDLVHCHSPFSAGRYALHLARKRNIPIVATFHSKYRDDFLRAVHVPRVAEIMLRRVIDFYKAVDEVWIPQAKVEETLREYGYEGPVVVMENGTDFAPGDNILQTKINARKLLGHKEGDIVFLFVGQLILEKNRPMIIASLAELNDLSYTAYFIGQGYAAEQLKQLAEELGIAGKLRFPGTIYNREDLLYYYAAADLFLFPSLYDNAPLVVREAAAMHTPSLLVEGSTAAEIICDGENGFLTRNDKIAIAAKIRSVIANRALLQRVGEGAAHTVARPWRQIMEEVKQRYLMLINKN